MKTDMTRNLSEPVTAVSSLPHGLSTAQMTEFEQLGKQLQALKKQHRKIQKQSRQVSRQIGEAKRNGESIDDLKATMQTFSRRLKELDAQCGKIERRLEQLLGPAHENRMPEAALSTSPPEKPATRYRETLLDNADDVAISLMDDGQEAWNTYVENHPAGTIHHRAEWQGLLEQTYSLQSYYFTARDADGRVVGVLPLARHTSRLFGDFLVSMPWFAHAGAIAEHPLIEHKLMQAANETAAALGCAHIEYRDEIPREDLPAQTHKVNMVLALPETVEQLWQGFTPKLRAQIRRPQHEDPRVSVGGMEYLDDFYRVYARNMRDLGSPPHSKTFVKHILECFHDNSWLVVLYLHGQPVGGGLLLGMGNTLEIPLASTIREVNPLSMNMLLYWEVLKFAIDHGYSQFDFGRSSIDAGTYRFKRQWGAQPKQLYWHYWLGKKGALPSLNPSNPKYRLVICIWKRIPVWLTRWLGPMLIKHLP
jgi:serine/alanine adding enzyme